LLLLLLLLQLCNFGRGILDLHASSRWCVSLISTSTSCSTRPAAAQGATPWLQHCQP
jgi:hypothetical protein